MICLYSIQSLDEIPVGTEYRILADRLGTGSPSYIQTREPCDLTPQDNAYENGVAIVDDGCIAEWVVKEGSIVPVDEIKQTVEKVNEFARTHTIETLDALLEAAPIDNAVGLYNADGIERIKKVE